MPNNRSTQLLDEYSRTVAQYGINSTEVRVAADVLTAAGVDVPSNATLYGGVQDRRTSKELIEAALAPDKTSTDAEPLVDDYGSMAGRAEPYMGWRGKEFKSPIRTFAEVMGYNTELARLSKVQEKEVIRSRRVYGKDDHRSIETFRQYKIIRNQLARAHTQGTWAKSEFQTYIDAPTKSNYDLFIKAAEKTQVVSPLAAAPPKRPELEEERGMIFSTLLFLESVSGTTIYNLRKKLGFDEIDWIEQTEAEEAIKEISPSQALGYTTRETRVWTPRGITGLLIDIGLDPLTYMTIFGTVASVGGKVLKIGKAGKKAKIEAEGIKILEQQTKWIREAFPDVSAKEAREAAESLVFGIAKHRKELLAARKYQEPSFSIFGQPLLYPGDVKKVTDVAWKKLPYYKKRQSAYKDVEHEVRKTFEPFYEVGQAAGEKGKDIFKKIIRRTDYERDVWGKRAKDLYKKGPKFWRRKEAADVHEQTLEWIQRGVEPTDPRAYEMAEDLVVAQREMAEAEIAAGLLDPTTLREGYVFRVYTPEFRKEVLEKEFGHRPGEDIAMYTRQLESKYPREFLPEMSHKEVNEWAMREYGIKALITDPSQILQMRGIESSRARAMVDLRRQVGEELGTPAEQLFPLHARKYKKYTTEEVDEMVSARYAERYEELQKEAGVPLGVRPEDVEDVARYLEREGGFDITRLGDKRAAETIVAREASERAERYTRDLEPFYALIRDVGEGKLEVGRMEDIEGALRRQRSGMFAGMRVTTPSGKELKISEFLVPVKKEASEYRRYETEIAELNLDLKKYRRGLESRPSMADEYAAEITATEKSIAHKRAMQEKNIAEIRASTLSIQREIIEPSEKKISRQRRLAGLGEIPSIEWGAALPTEIGEMPATISPFAWTIHATRQTVAQEKLTKLTHERDIYYEKLIAAYKIEPLPESIMVGPPGAKQKLLKHPYGMPTGEQRVAYVDEAVIKELDQKVEQTANWLATAEKYTRWGYTVPWVPFHIRNIQGILQQNLYSRVSPQSYAMNWEILHGDPEKMFDVPVYGKMKAGEIKQMYEEAGIYGKIGYIEDPMKFKELPMGPMPEIENLGRGALATELLMKGEGIDEAAHIVRQYHFEYGGAGLTTRERKYARHMFLFYTWPKKNVELTTRMLGQQPGTIAAAMKFQQVWITPEEYEELPWWARESYVLTANGEFYVLDVPALNALQLMTGEGYAFSHTPFLKFYIGAVWGRDPTTGQPLGIEDMPRWTAEAGIGRFMSLKREFERVQEDEIPWTRMAKHQLGGVYVGELEDIPLKRAYLESQMVEWKATEEEKLAAFEASGMRASHYEVLWKPPPALRGEVMEEPKPWWQKYPWDWGYPWDEEEPEFVGEKGVVVGYSQEEWDIIAGHRLSDEQKEEVKLVLETSGVDVAAGLRTQMAAEYHAARAAFAGREPVTPKQITESYNRLVARVGAEAAKKAHYRTYYSEEDELLGIMAFTEKEWEDVEGYELSEEQKQWMFRETLTPEEEEYNRRIELANRIEGIQSLTAMVFPRPTIEPHPLSEKKKMALDKKWRKLEEETGFRPSEAQMKWATTTDWLEVGGVEKKMTFGEQMEYFSKEYEAEQDQERLMREELTELRADPRGTTKARKDEYVSDLLMVTCGGEDIGIRMARKQELEDLLGVGVDR